MNKERQLHIIPTALAAFLVIGFFLSLLQKVQYQSITTVEPVDIQYILSSQKRKELLPFGDTSVLPDFRYVALYGSPLYSALGVLGEQSIDASIAKVKDLAKKYQPFSEETVIPAMEIITTIASEGATENGDYSQETTVKKILPWVEKAYDQGMYVLLDLQPGRANFLTQAKQYEELLKYPHVGLALDPEWRLGANQIHLQQIGSVSAQEVNSVSNWLANLVAREELPQKVFLIHQFRNDMITNRNKLDTSREELGYVIQMDGNGTQAGKDDTYQAITTNPPKNVYFGWKNFYDEDKPVRSPKDTMAVSPKPWFVSYQ